MSDPIRDLKRELLAAAERQHRSAPMATGLWGRLRAPSRVLLVTASLSIAAALALVVSAPWSDSPGLLEEAQAALTAPPDTIRHDKWEVTSTSTEPACTVTRGPTELWTDTMPPYRWRVLLRDLPLVEEDASPDVSEPDCWRGVTSELGGTSNPVCTAAGCEPILRLSLRTPCASHRSRLGFSQTRCRAFETRLITDWRTMRERRSSAGGPSNVFASTHPTVTTPISLVPPDVRVRRPRDVLSRRDPPPRVPRRALRRALPHVRVPASNPRKPRTHRHPSPAPRRVRDRKSMTELDESWTRRRRRRMLQPFAQPPRRDRSALGRRARGAARRGAPRDPVEERRAHGRSSRARGS